MALRELFHLVSIVNDFDSAQSLLDELFAPVEVFGKSWSDFDRRWASIGMICPDVPFELMEPSKDPAHADAPLVKFRARFGQHLHSLAWFVAEGTMPPIVGRLQDHNVRVVADTGVAIGPDDEVPDLVFTHGRDTFGQIELMVPRRAPTSRPSYPHLTGAWPDGRPSAWWAEHHPLGVIGLSHVTVAANDITRGLDIFQAALGGQLLHRTESSAFVLVGKETIVELATPTDLNGALAHDLANNGELPHQCTLLVRNLDAAEKHASACGCASIVRTPDTIVLDPTTTFGSRFALTSVRVPGDPRGR
jgi:hypothetical protein